MKCVVDCDNMVLLSVYGRWSGRDKTSDV